MYTKTPAVFKINGKDVYAPKYTAFLYEKNAVQIFKGYNELYINDYIHFDVSGEADELFIKSLPLIYNTPLCLSNVESFMNVQRQIVHETFNKSEQAPFSTDLLLKYFLIKLSEAMELNDKNYQPLTIEAMYNLRSRIYQNPEQQWNIKRMADEVNFSIPYFQSLYKNIFRISGVRDVINARVEKAKELLLQTDKTARDIAVLCGYENETHFSRQFKKIIGNSPIEYRKKHN